MKGKISIFYIIFLFMLLLTFTSDLELSLATAVLTFAVLGFLGYEIETYDEIEGTDWLVYSPLYEEWVTEVRI